MKYIRNVKSATWIGVVDDDASISENFVEITKDEYDRIHREMLSDLIIDDPCC